MSNDFYSGYYEDHYSFAHHGILGQKWGDKNGPPYPLDPGDHSAKEKKAGWVKSLKNYHAEKKKKKQRKKALEKARVALAEKKKQEELKRKFEADKEKVLRSGKASEILKYKGQMTNDEMEYAIQRINKEERLYGLSEKEHKTAMDKIDGIFKKVGTATDWVNKAVNAYDAIDKLTSRLSGEDENKILDDVVKSGNLNKIMAYKDKLSNNQLNDAVNRYNRERELTNLFDKMKNNTEAKEKAHTDLVDKVTKSGDLDLITKHVKDLTSTELAYAINKYNKEKELENLLKELAKKE